MPKVSIVYNLPEEQSEFNTYKKAAAYQSIIWDFTELLRTKTKYATGSTETDWEDVRSYWWNFLKDEGVDPYDEN